MDSLKKRKVDMLERKWHVEQRVAATLDNDRLIIDNEWTKQMRLLKVELLVFRMLLYTGGSTS